MSAEQADRDAARDAMIETVEARGDLAVVPRGLLRKAVGIARIEGLRGGHCDACDSIIRDLGRFTGRVGEPTDTEAEASGLRL